MGCYRTLNKRMMDTVLLGALKVMTVERALYEGGMVGDKWQGRLALRGENESYYLSIGWNDSDSKARDGSGAYPTTQVLYTAGLAETRGSGATFLRHLAGERPGHLIHSLMALVPWPTTFR